jgi:hypothetical protein
MGEQGIVPYDAGPKTVEIDYQPRGYLTPEATKTTALTVENVTVASGAMGNIVTGDVANPGTAAVSGPEIYLFPQDSGGRPYDFGYDSSTADLAVGSSWSFHMTIPSPINKCTAFPHLRSAAPQIGSSGCTLAPLSIEDQRKVTC